MANPATGSSTSQELQKQINPLAVTSFVLACIALFLALLGALYAGNQTRVNNVHGVIRALVVLVTYLGPIAMGIGAMYYGNQALEQIESNRQTQRGDGFGVFAALMGMLTVVIAGCETFAFVIWPLL
ncbi:hypothetical protein [Tuwongella immobilis]|uniref:Uncharacterized protein n=1 Tax=Tuwongella immobilis TaxID=692036 RepID=A0A6C2YVG5_9BACT|nr:hypothetical protein [Tuwongella immobilis]VIP04862.1 unnamed protein product [Tuwongella immobilis]VTS07083.1 unnamed protein product [Tuwongella immobilis]